MIYVLCVRKSFHVIMITFASQDVCLMVRAPGGLDLFSTITSETMFPTLGNDHAKQLTASSWHIRTNFFDIYQKSATYIFAM